MNRATERQRTKLATIIRERRAIKKHYTDKTVSKDMVYELLEDAIWAPTHGLRQPWRFIFVGEDQRPSFANKIASTYSEERQENREDYLNEPNAILVVIMEEPELQKQWEDNFGAVSSMIQNFWLLAWEQELGVVWKTNPHNYDPQVKDILNVGETEKIVGFIHLGYFSEKPAAKDRIPVIEKFEVYQG